MTVFELNTEVIYFSRSISFSEAFCEYLQSVDKNVIS